MSASQPSLSPSLIDYFEDLEDPRMDRRKAHPLINVLFIAVCAVLCGAEGWRSIETFGKAKQRWLVQFLQLPEGAHPVPSDDTYRRTISRLDPEAFETAFRRWVAAVGKRIDGRSLPWTARPCAVLATGTPVSWRPPGDSKAASSRQRVGL